MPMATAVPFILNAEVSQAGLGNFESMNSANVQVPVSPDLDIVQLGASQNGSSSGLPYLTIIEQPKSKWRYRYQSEKGSHGPLPGCTTNRKTYPTAKVINFPDNLEIYVRASLWTVDETSLHVHKLVGQHCSDDGTCTVKMGEDGTVVLQDVTILFVAKKDVPEIMFQRILKEGKHLNLAEDKLKKSAEEKAKKMNLNSVRICFEAYYLNHNKTLSLCSPVFSEPVANQRSPKDGDLKICRMSRFTGSVLGGDEVFLFCSKFDKKDIRVRFHESSSSWEAFGTFNEADVHQQVAMVFLTPPYHRQDIAAPAKVLLELQRKSGEASESKEFTYIPDDADDERIRKKRKKNCLHQEFDEFRGDVNRNNEEQVSIPVVQNQNSPMSVESVDGSSLGSTSSCGGYNDEQLGANFFSLGCQLSFDEILNSDPFTMGNSALESSGALFESHNDPLLSEAIVPKWNWFLPDGPTYTDANPSLKMDAAVPSVRPSENVENKPLAQKDVSVKSQEMEEAFSRLVISGKSAAVSENSASSNSKTDQQEVTNEEAVKNGQSVSTLQHKMEECQQSAVSESSLETVWYSLAVGVIRRNPFEYLRNMPQVIGLFDKNRNTLLHLAVAQQPPCEFIIECLLKMAEETSCPVVNFLNKNNMTPLHFAITAKKPSVVKLLLKYGADPTVTNRCGFSSYHLAICVKSKECLCELLLKKNYKSPPITFDLDSTDYEGLAPLHYAVKEELTECITLLCVNGADVNIRSKKEGRTPLHFAALQNSKIASILFSKKTIDVNAQDFGGNTPLHLACARENSEVVKMLMVNGANSLICNVESIRPYEFAKGNEEIKDIIMRKVELEMNSRKEASSASCTTKVHPQSGSLEFQCKSVPDSFPSSGDTSASQGDSGYITGKLPALNEDLMQKLGKLLDPPSDLWKKLMMLVFVDEDFERNILKLTSKPTKAILTLFTNDGGTADSLIAALEAVELFEARDIVFQHMS